MKLKSRPEDFQVCELTDRSPAAEGAFALYALTKRGLGTPEAVQAIQRAWKIERRRVSYGGLKDRHALTRQHLTIAGGPPHGLTEKSLELEYLGRTDRAFAAKDIRANRFRIVMRALAEPDALAAREALQAAARDGVANYFDDQRFGSVGRSGELVARSWIAKDWERALWLALADPNAHDRPRERRDKAFLAERWGDWPAVKARIERSHRRSVVTYLCDHPADFKGAFALLSADLRSLYLSAFQGHLWNRMLSDWLSSRCPPEALVPVRLRMGPVPFFRDLDEPLRAELGALALPLPSARARLAAGPMRDLAERVVGETGLALEDVVVRHPRGSFFSRGERAAVLRLAGPESALEPDEIYPGKSKLALAFELPRGSYATMVVKRLTVAAPLGEKR